MAERVFLTGFMGTGKTAVGRALARRLRLPFRDADAEIERRAGMTIAELFARRGEKAFRALERRVVRELAARGGVISLGGGALLDPSTARLAHPRVTLTCSERELWRRLKPELPVRPLLAGGRPALRRLLRARRGIYRGSLFSISTTTLSTDQAAREIARRVRNLSLG